MAFKTRISSAPQNDDLDLSTTITLGDRLAFRTCSAIDRTQNTQFFYVAHFNPESGSFEKRKVEYPLTADEVVLLGQHGIKGLRATSDKKRLKVDNRFAQAAEKGYRITGFLEMAKELLYFDDEAQMGYKSCIALPEALRAKELEILGTFHIRNYLIEEGYIATKPDHDILHRSDIIALSELQENAFDPRIVTDIDPREWLYAGQRVANAVSAKPIYITSPYDDISPLRHDEFLVQTPLQPRKTDRASILGDMQATIQAEQERRKREEDQAQYPKTLSHSEQKWIIEALLTQARDMIFSKNRRCSVNDYTPEWLALLKSEYGHDLRLSDLADEHGPLGALFYAAHGEYANKYAFEALPALADHFEAQGTPIPPHYLHVTKMDGVSLYDRIKATEKELPWNTAKILERFSPAPSTASHSAPKPR